MTSILLGPKLKNEIEVLKKDPIIIKMAKVMFEADDSPSDPGLMSVASQFYRQRGGANSVTIGGPIRAIKSLIEEYQRGA